MVGQTSQYRDGSICWSMSVNHQKHTQHTSSISNSSTLLQLNGTYTWCICHTRVTMSNNVNTLKTDNTSANTWIWWKHSIFRLHQCQYQLICMHDQKHVCAWYTHTWECMHYCHCECIQSPVYTQGQMVIWWPIPHKMVRLMLTNPWPLYWSLQCYQ